MNNAYLLAAAIALATGASPAISQQNDWDYESTIHPSAPETTTNITTPARTIEGNLDFSDALSNLDFALMSAFGASTGRWSFPADNMYTDLSFGNPPPGPGFARVDTTRITRLLNGYVAYRVRDEPDVQIDLAGGFRWLDTKSSLTLHPVPPGGTNAVDESWIDPVIGTRARFAMSEKWRGTTFFDYGGFPSGEKTRQDLPTADYAFNDKWLLRGGYRHLTVDHATNSTDSFSLTQSGLIFGATYRL